MSLEHAEILRIDHLSSLPPELLLSILDSTFHPDQRLSIPPSRTLLPYWRSNLYRRAYISSTSSLTKFLDTVKSYPSLGLLVQSLEINKTPENVKDYTPSHPALRGCRYIGRPPPRVPNFPPLSTLDANLAQWIPNLESISYQSRILSFDDVHALEGFTKLKHISFSLITESNMMYGIERNRPPPSCVNRILSLSVSHIRIRSPYVPWGESLAAFIDQFPRINSLSLTDDAPPDYRDLLGQLSHVTESLSSITLDGPTLYEDHNIACDHHLPRFQNLQRLDLGECTISPSLPLYLSQLPRLSHLRLGPATQSYGPTSEGLLSLVEGPSRLVALKKLVLDSVEGKVGRKVDINDHLEEEEEFRPFWEDGWERPFFDEWKFEDLNRLLVAGEENGVDVRGSTFPAMEIYRESGLEYSNRVILKAFRTKSLKEYLRTLNDPAEEDLPLPRLDLSILDRESLRLVKIELPKEEGWYRFTLESDNVKPWIEPEEEEIAQESSELESSQ
ncbi:hypothetical protein JCM3765_001840 [Sporobolomyces pararoseus]